jgi:N-hydroxyarylamine O-acetyltransferase
MNFDKYLKRINTEGFAIDADFSTLKFLQKQHLLNVPFENLDIHWKTPITLDIGEIFHKIVENGRGGFCYELNGLFFELLGSIGFERKRISACVCGANGVFGPEYDHFAILTKIDGIEYLVDVGFGEFSAEPLKFVVDEEQKDKTGIFIIRKFDDEYFEVAKQDEEHWKTEYIFKDLSREFHEFSEMCDFHQTSPESHFTQNIVCSRMTREGRKTLTGEKFIETKNGVRTITEIDSAAAFNSILAREFSIKRSG